MEIGLERFVNAQQEAYPRALAEIRAGRKESHWMWYIFPQIHGLGHSFHAAYYAIRNRREAESYLAHPVLGPRLVEISSALLMLDTCDAREILEYPDDLKLHSCMTLFYDVSGNPVFQNVLDKFYGGKPDPLTLSCLDQEE